jgi:hypothetical protein
MQEIVKLLLKDPAYMRVGARCPRVGGDTAFDKTHRGVCLTSGKVFVQ